MHMNMHVYVWVYAYVCMGMVCSRESVSEYKYTRHIVHINTQSPMINK